ncbi:uracil-DNA glycosylase [Streptomyces rhizosphaerihabitans]|uniref:uracil-DNA glycosylase n=1 Tax=Streptomyces rhizosphaerihabitans TaxID=1266770 RepID=UPI0021C21139|nr:uracil-DNA glycosylase [Streptomyces rhizosphaerihabitans]MCT9005028.1 uracil-DNA glycosylase [Streptomyces rhizosphaerihabitans]
MYGPADLAGLDARIAGCRACPRLVAWREEVAVTKRAAFADQTYWGRPVPGFGPADASLLVVGLAPAAHGGNRTGRMFTGDRSGDVLYAALHDVGLASQGTSVSADDGLELYGVRVTSPVHCAPPANKPTPQERDTCRPWLVRELELLRPTLRAAVVLGAFGWQAALPAFAEAGWTVPRPRPTFAHGARVTLGRRPEPERTDADADTGTRTSTEASTNTGTDSDPVSAYPPEPASASASASVELFGCFHVSQRNTFTGRLTPEMLREVLSAAAESAGLTPRSPRG